MEFDAGERVSAGGSVLRDAGGADVSDDDVDSEPGVAGVHAGAGYLPRRVWACADACASGVCGLSAALRQAVRGADQPERSGAARAAVLVHGGVWGDSAGWRDEGVWEWIDFFAWGVHARDQRRAGD